MLVSEIMSSDVVMIGVDSTIEEADALMREHELAFLPVVHEDVCAGVLTAQAIDVQVREAGRDPATVSVGEIMSPGVGGASPHDLGANEAIAAIPANATVEEAAQRMEDFHVRRMAVHDSDYHIVGIVSRSDLPAHASP